MPTYGYLQSINDSSTGNPVSTVNARDAELHLTQETLAAASGGVVVSRAFDPNTGLISSITASAGNAVGITVTVYSIALTLCILQ